MEDQPFPTVHRTRVLKLEPNCCTECARKVKRAMLKVDGVHSIRVNSEEGTIQVESEIDPQVLIAMAAKAGKRAELLWESQPENISATTPSTGIATQHHVHLSNFDHTEHLQDLLDKYSTRIKHMEIVDKRVTKITFKESLDYPHTNGGETTASRRCGNVEATPPPVAASSSAPPSSEINDAPCNSSNQVVETPVADLSCTIERTHCSVM